MLTSEYKKSGVNYKPKFRAQTPPAPVFYTLLAAVTDLKMALVKKFKAQRDTKRYRKNQDIWIQLEAPNHLRVIHKWRGKGRYVQSYVSKWNDKQPTGNPNDEVFSLIGSLENIRKIEVNDSFAKRHGLQRFD